MQPYFDKARLHELASFYEIVFLRLQTRETLSTYVTNLYGVMFR